MQMRNPFTGRWLKINPDNGAIVEVAWAAWQDIPHLPISGTPPPVHRIVLISAGVYLASGGPLPVTLRRASGPI